MVTERHFARFVKGRSASAGTQEYNALAVKEIPEDGICMSTFLIISSSADPATVLMGHLNPEARWEHLGALDSSRTEVHSRGWMLPSSHLVMYESPQESAKRVLKEQLGLQGLELLGPMVVSEVGPPKRFPDLRMHWDLEFIFRGVLAGGAVPRNEAWRELRFVDPRTTKRTEIARSHDEILESAGFKFGG